MTLQFAREVIIIAGLPVIGTIEVEAEAEIDRYDGLYDLHLVCTGFEAEDGQKRPWSAVERPCEDWLRQNRGMVERRAFERH